MSSTSDVRPWLLFALFCSAAGCGGPTHVDVQGAVTFQGKPIPEGELRFIPIEGTHGPVTGAPIVDGQYRCVGKNNVPAGKHQVQISAYKKVNSKTPVKEPTTIEDMPASVQYLPEKYNTRTTLELTITNQRGVQTLDFNLE